MRRKVLAMGIFAAAAALAGCAIPPDVYYAAERDQPLRVESPNPNVDPPWEMQDETEYKNDMSR